MTEKIVQKLLILQTLFVVGMVIICAIFSGRQAVYSAILAGFCCMLPTFVFGCIAFRKKGARAAQGIMRDFYRAEACKWIVTMILMIGIFGCVSVMAAAFFITFSVIQLSSLVLLFIL